MERRSGRFYFSCLTGMNCKLCNITMKLSEHMPTLKMYSPLSDVIYFIAQPNAFQSFPSRQKIRPPKISLVLKNRKRWKTIFITSLWSFLTFSFEWNEKFSFLFSFHDLEGQTGKQPFLYRPRGGKKSRELFHNLFRFVS